MSHASPAMAPYSPSGHSAPASKGKRVALVVVFIVVAVAVSLLTSMLLRGGGDPTADDMRQVQGEGFTVSLPGEAKKTTTPVEETDLTLTTHTVDTENVGYAVSYADFEDGIEINLDGAVDGTAGSMKGKVVSNETTEIQGHEARDAVVTGEFEGKQVTGFIAVTTVGQRLYTVQTLVRGADQPMPELHRAVVDSLRFS